MEDEFYYQVKIDILEWKNYIKNTFNYDEEYLDELLCMSGRILYD